MTVLWTALIVFLHPSGTLLVDLNPHTFSTEAACQEYLEFVLPEKPTPFVKYNACLPVLPGRDI